MITVSVPCHKCRREMQQADQVTLYRVIEGVSVEITVKRAPLAPDGPPYLCRLCIERWITNAGSLVSKE